VKAGDARDNLGKSVELLGRLSKGLQRAPKTDEQIIDLDRLANEIAMDLCDWDNAIAEVDDQQLDDAVVAFASASQDVLKRYAQFRADRPALPISNPQGIDVLSAGLGLDVLSRKEGWEFLGAIWRSERDAERVKALGKPSAKFELVVQLDPTKLHWPGYEDLAELATNYSWGNFEFEDLTGTTWEDVQHALRSERNLVEEAREQAKPGATLVDLDIDALDDISVMELGPMDLGLASATLALNAVGCPTFDSCAGHIDGFPYVLFWARPAWATLLVEAAKDAGIGLYHGNFNLVEISAHSYDLLAFVRFAEALTTRRTKFQELIDSDDDRPEPTIQLQD
jgi:hypothetical protein